ncbi:hypothetical protein ERJ75_000102200 [Trypanosoma vivax]|nr:hypothetical protein ERJ75_000102200 [Trypanosoma vivax]
MIIPPFTSSEEWITTYALSTINALDITTGSMVVPLMFSPNVTHSSLSSTWYADDDLPARQPAKLLRPAVGTANTVRLGLDAYVVGFCMTIPYEVYTSPGEVLNATLRSVQVIQLYEEEHAPVDDLTMSIRSHSLPDTATLRYNASCIGDGKNIIYIIGVFRWKTDAPFPLPRSTTPPLASSLSLDGFWMPPSYRLGAGEQ